MHIVVELIMIASKIKTPFLLTLICLISWYQFLFFIVAFISFSAVFKRACAGG